jgi:hypothetical protein
MLRELQFWVIRKSGRRTLRIACCRALADEAFHVDVTVFGGFPLDEVTLLLENETLMLPSEREQPEKGTTETMMTVLTVEPPAVVAPQVTLLHSRSQLVGRQDLLGLPIPEATRTHVPVPHAETVAALVQSLGYRNIEVVADEYALTERILRVMEVHSTFEFGVRGGCWTR